MRFNELQYKLNELAEEFLSDMDEVSAEELGIDTRAARRFYVSEEGIAIEMAQLRSVEYYAGFEYESDYKSVIGDYVFWSADSNRIRGHMSRLEQYSHFVECEEE